jgi:predicted NUDIX family phosphoesterase
VSKMDEVIIVAPRRELFSDERDAFHGFLPLADPRLETILRGLCASPRGARRGDVEEDPSLKQPIPYVVVTRHGEKGAEVFAPEVFTYVRLTGGGEARLHGKMSVGVGGHMNRGFTRETLETVVWEEAARELAEELRFEDGSGAEVDPPAARFVGLINDDTGPVQQVHLGLLAVAEVPAGTHVAVRETDQLDGRWERLDALHAPDVLARMESWSLHALEGIRDGR